MPAHKPPIEESWPASKTELWPIEKIIPYDKNPRTHPKEQIDLIASSMASDGVTAPILIDEAGIIIYGHGRRLASIQNGFERYPVIVARGWSEERKRAVRIRDNSLSALSGWDKQLMTFELAELQSTGFDLLTLGLEEYELRSFGIGDATGMGDPEDAPEPPAKPVSRLGDLWCLGDHRILCGNSLDAQDIGRLCGGVRPDLANCDPPYGINVVKRSTDGGAKPFGKVGGGKPHPFAGKKAQGHVPGLARLGPAIRGRVHGPARNAIIQPGIYAPVIGDESTDTAIGSYGELIRLGVLSIVMWGGNYFANQLPPSRCWLVWDKENTGSFADAELAWTNLDSTVKLIRHQWSGLIKASERGERRIHPTQKPVALAEWVIDTIAPKAKSVIDLFLGSGSTLIACQRKKIAFFGMELAPAYIDASLIRWQNYTGQEALLEATGQTYAEVKAEREKLARRKAPQAATKKPGRSRAGA